MSKLNLDFQQLILHCRTKDRKRIIHNASIVHAKELFIALFEESKDNNLPIKITSCNLKLDFYEALVNKARDVLDSEIPMQLAVLHPDAHIDEHPFVNLLKEYPHATVYQATTKKLKVPHFILVGEDRFRMETNHAQSKAIACFDNPSIGRILSKEFDNMLQSLPIIQLHPA